MPRDARAYLADIIVCGGGPAPFSHLVDGTLFVGPGLPVYTGMVVGENSRGTDLVVNPCKGKKLTNMRASGSDINVILTPPKIMSLEQILGFLNEDELAEITPKSIRLRKKLLDENDRKRFSKTQKAS